MPSANNRHACDELLLLIPAYAIGATDPDETAFVEAALPGCPEARAELDDYRRMSDDLRAGVPQVEPPAALLTRILDATTKTSPVPTPQIFMRPAPRRRLHPAWFALAAALLLLVVSNAFWLTRQTTVPVNGDEDALLLAQDITWRRLENDDGTNAWALILWNPQRESGVLCAYNFPQLQSDRVYQLWLRDADQQRVSGGTFTVNERGFGLLRVRAGMPIDGFEVAGVTTEPLGSTAPTGDSVVRGEL